MRVPRPLGGCHQCCTSPSTNCRDAARSRCARQRSGPRVEQRQHVLQLIAEAERAARLVRAAARPDAAAQRLVEQPAIDDQVERIVWRLHLHGAERLVPELRRACQRARRPRRATSTAPRARRRAVASRALAEDERDLPRLARPGSRRSICSARAGVEPGAGAAGQARPRRAPPARPACGCGR